jgi:hypothetical protein
MLDWGRTEKLNGLWLHGRMSGLLEQVGIFVKAT